MTAAESARYYCKHCGTAWTEPDRHSALSRGRLVHSGQGIDESGRTTGDMPRTKTFGLRCSKLDYHLGLGVPDLAVEHRRAKIRADVSSDHGLLRSFYRDRLSQPYTLDQATEDSAPQQLTRAWLAARSTGSHYGFSRQPIRDENGDGYYISECPPEVEAIVAACDVQRGGLRAPPRLYFLVTGFTADFRTYDLAWGSLVMAPMGQAGASTAELHAGLDRLDALVSELGQDYGRTVVRRGVDVGDRQDEIRQWLIRHPSWWPVKGSGNSKADDNHFDIGGWIYRRQQEGRWHLYLIEVEKVRQQAQNGFLVKPNTPGAAHLPRGILAQDSIAKHYCATALIPDGRGGVTWSWKRCADHFEWNNRRDLLDCRTYGLALAHQWLREADRRRAMEEYTKAIEQPKPTDPGWIDNHSGEGSSWL